MIKYKITGSGVYHEKTYSYELGSDKDYDIDEDNVKEIEFLLRKINCVPKLKGVQPSSYSYKLKHLAERAIGHYVSNGEFIKAAHNMGYDLMEVRPPNCYFNISKKALYYLRFLNKKNESNFRSEFKYSLLDTIKIIDYSALSSEERNYIKDKSPGRKENVIVRFNVIYSKYFNGRNIIKYRDIVRLSVRSFKDLSSNIVNVPGGIDVYVSSDNKEILDKIISIVKEKFTEFVEIYFEDLYKEYGDVTYEHYSSLTKKEKEYYIK